MGAADGLRKPIKFLHSYPRQLCEGLSEEQLHWHPEGHSNHIVFILWHAFRAEDAVVHRFLMEEPAIFVTGDWARRLPGVESGVGTGFSEEQATAVRLPVADLLAYGDAVGAASLAYAESLTEAEAAEEVQFPFYDDPLPQLKVMTRAEALTWFSTDHMAIHLGEAMYIKGLQGFSGAPM